MGQYEIGRTLRLTVIYFLLFMFLMFVLGPITLAPLLCKPLLDYECELRPAAPASVAELGERVYLESPETLLDAIRKAEGVPSYGVVYLARRFGNHRKVPERMGRRAAARIVHSSYKEWVRTGRSVPFISYLGDTYAPLKAENDPTGLNRYWVRNVLKHLRRTHE